MYLYEEVGKHFMVDQYLDPTHLKKQGIFQPKVVKDLVSQHMMGGRYNAYCVTDVVGTLGWSYIDHRIEIVVVTKYMPPDHKLQRSW